MRAISYTSVVRMAGVLLPVAALGLLSTLFLVARTADPAAAVQAFEEDVTSMAREQQLTRPRVAGVSAEGTAYLISLTAARPDPQDARRLTAEDIRLELDHPGKGRAVISATNGMVDTADRTVILDGEVQVETSTGYTLRTGRLIGQLSGVSIVAPEEVIGTSPIGPLRAGSVRLVDRPDGGQVLTFSDRVELIYRPPADKD